MVALNFKYEKNLLFFFRLSVLDPLCYLRGPLEWLLPELEKELCDDEL